MDIKSLKITGIEKAKKQYLVENYMFEVIKIVSLLVLKESEGIQCQSR